MLQEVERNHKNVEIVLPDGTKARHDYEEIVKVDTDDKRAVRHTSIKTNSVTIPGEGSVPSLEEANKKHKTPSAKLAESAAQQLQTTGGVYANQEQTMKKAQEEAKKSTDALGSTNKQIITPSEGQTKSDTAKKESSINNPKGVTDPSNPEQGKIKLDPSEQQRHEEVLKERPAAGQDTNVFYVDVKVLLEGVQVPHNSVAISYGISSPPTCSITIPAANFLRNIPEATKILVIYKDLLPDPHSHVHEWRVLFDGEVSGYSYNVTSTGANMQIQGVHSAAYLSYMQIQNQTANEYIFNKEFQVLGNITHVTMAGANKSDIDVIKKILDKTTLTTASDVTYFILRHLLEGSKDLTPVGRWYWSKLGNIEGGYKILKRIYGYRPELESAEMVGIDISGGKIVVKSETPRIAAGGKDYDPKANTTTPDGYTSTLKAQNTITSGYEWREHPITGEYKFHPGIDLAYSAGTGIVPFTSGVVSQTGNEKGGYGLYVEVRHPDGTHVLYAHLQAIFVEEGEEVVKGSKDKLIGLVGSTGASNGPHLHFSYYKNPVINTVKKDNTMNPIVLLD